MFEAGGEQFKLRKSGRVHSKRAPTADARFSGHHFPRLMQNASQPHLPTCLFYYMRENDKGQKMKKGLQVFSDACRGIEAYFVQV